MEPITLKGLSLVFSKARMSPYLKNNNSAEHVLAEYHKNIILSEALTPTLHYFEIVLRNRIDHILKQYYSSNWLLDRQSELIVSDRDVKKIDEIASKIKREN